LEARSGAVAAAAGSLAAAVGGGLITGAAAGESASGAAPVTVANTEASNETCGVVAVAAGATGSL